MKPKTNKNKTTMPVGSGAGLGCIACKQCGGVVGKPKIRVGIYFQNDQPQFRFGTSQVICDNCGCAGPRCGTLDCAVKLWNELMQPNAPHQPCGASDVNREAD